MQKRPEINIIVAIADDNAIGKDDGLLIHLPEDLKWFKKNTLGYPVIMGRKTYESLPNGALPKRKNIVLTRNLNFSPADATVVHGADEALQVAGEAKKVFVIGGAEIYKIFLPLTDRIVLTRIYKKFDADTFFPDIDWTEWEEEEHINNKVSVGGEQIDFDFIILNKKI